MSLDPIPTRSTGQTILDEFFNVLKRVLTGNFAPRNTSGTVEDEAGDMGTPEIRWRRGYLGEYLSIGDPTGTHYRLEIRDISGLKLQLSEFNGGTRVGGPIASAGGLNGLAVNSVLSATIQDGSVLQDKISNGAVSTPKLRSKPVTPADRDIDTTFNSTSWTTIATVSNELGPFIGIGSQPNLGFLCFSPIFLSGSDVAGGGITKQTANDVYRLRIQYMGSNYYIELPTGTKYIPGFVIPISFITGSAPDILATFTLQARRVSGADNLFIKGRFGWAAVAGWSV